MILFKTDYLEIFYHEADRLVETRWLGFATSLEYRQGLVSCLNIVANYEVNFWLDNYQRAKGIQRKDVEWTVNVWAPQFMRFAQTKIERMAKIISPAGMNKADSKNKTNDLNVTHFPVFTQEFKKYEDALNWLLGKNFIQHQTFRLAI